MQIDKSNLTSALYLVSTPIGNLRDVTLRALETLNSADVIFCEDTRMSTRLLSHYGIKTKLNNYTDHSDENTRNYIFRLIGEGKAVALVSDAGTPLISDPGYKLVREAVEAGIKVVSVPGASSVIAGLSISGQPTDSFYFVGFLPNTSQGRQNKISELENIKSTLIFMERAERVGDLAADFIEVLGNHKASLVREITKMYEENIYSSLSEIKELAGQGKIKGECVLFVNTREKIFSESQNPNNLETQDEYFKELLAKYKLSEAADIASKKLGVQKKKIYNRMLELR